MIVATAYYLASRSGRGLYGEDLQVGIDEEGESANNKCNNSDPSRRGLNYWDQEIKGRLESIRKSRSVQEALKCYIPPNETFGEGEIHSTDQDHNSNRSRDPICNDGTPSTSMVSSTPSLSEPPSNIAACCSLDTATSFRSDVRQEWINAVFGPDFTHTAELSSTTKFPQSTRQGVGLAEIPSYVSYNVSVPPGLNGDKLGITISRLPLGLYVRSVKPGTEAHCAGVKPNSVLVAINGMAMLAEPSRQALERIWQYEGLCDEMEDSRSLESSSSTASSSASGDSANSPMRIRDPVQMTFIYLGKLYSVLFLSNPPYGIEWSPCGNFALVKRSYGHGASIGIKRGSLVAAVNGTTLQDLDHTTAAAELRQAFESNDGIELQLCFTPSAARTGHFERQFESALPNRKPHRPKATAQHEGVEVRVHPVMWTRNKPHNESNSFVQFACRVAAGELYPLPRKLKFQPHQKAYRPCPRLSSLLRHWDEVDALLYCCRFHLSEYNDQVMSLPHTIQDGLVHLRQNDDATDVLETFLLQFISLACNQGTTQEQRDVRPDLTSMILEIAKSNISLVRQMELVVQSFDCGGLGSSLAKLRLDIMESEAHSELAPGRVSEAHATAIECFETQTTPIPAIVPDSHSKGTFQEDGDIAPLSELNEDSALAPSSPGKGKNRRPRVLAFFRKKKKSNKRFISNTQSSTLKEPTHPNISISNADEGTATTDIFETTSKTDAETTTLSNQSSATATIGLTYTSATSTTNHETLVAHAAVTPSLQPSVTAPGNAHEEVPVTDCSPFANTCSFLKDLEKVCEELEGSLLRSFSRKIADWALQPWSASKGTALAEVTQAMRERLARVNHHQCLLNPIDTTEILSSLDPKECYILPSAHFPWLLTFDCQAKTPRKGRHLQENTHLLRDPTHSVALFNQETMYRTKVELIALRGTSNGHRRLQPPSDPFRAFVIQGAVAGAMVESGRR